MLYYLIDTSSYNTKFKKYIYIFHCQNKDNLKVDMLQIIPFILFLLFNNANFFSDDLINHLGTKTPYRVTENNDTQQIAYEGNSEIYHDFFLLINKLFRMFPR